MITYDSQLTTCAYVAAHMAPDMQKIAHGFVRLLQTRQVQPTVHGQEPLRCNKHTTSNNTKHTAISQALVTTPVQALLMPQH
jgi:hypothetical protein